VTITLRGWTSATRRTSTALRHAQRLLAPSRAWQGQRLGRDSCTRGADRVEWIVFAAQPPLDAGVPADFEDRFTLTSLAPPSGPRQLP
jgi:hypothetical protein